MTNTIGTQTGISPGDRSGDSCIQVRIPTFEECTIEFEYEIEQDISPRKDFEDDESVYLEIESRLAAGDIAAWFMATCRCSWRGLEGESHLGCCSYNSFEEFETMEECYAADMRQEAYQELVKNIKRLAVESPQDLDRINRNHEAALDFVHQVGTILADHTPESWEVSLDGDLDSIMLYIGDKPRGLQLEITQAHVNPYQPTD